MNTKSFFSIVAALSLITMPLWCADKQATEITLLASVPAEIALKTRGYKLQEIALNGSLDVNIRLSQALPISTKEKATIYRKGNDHFLYLGKPLEKGVLPEEKSRKKISLTPELIEVIKSKKIEGQADPIDIFVAEKNRTKYYSVDYQDLNYNLTSIVLAGIGIPALCIAIWFFLQKYNFKV